MEADVNVLVVGSSTARRGAIGRHFPFPLIRRCLKRVLGRWLFATILSGRGWASEAGEGSTELSGMAGTGWGKRGVCVCACGVGLELSLPFSLLIWRA